jgi:peptidoglycan/LPS O-acetylase OafA/YrhL
MKILQWILALVFAATAGLKLAHTSPGMTQTMFSSLPHYLQWLVVGAELLMATWLASNWRPRWSAFFTIVLLSTFLGAILIEMGKPDPQPCGCFGAASTSSAMPGLWLSLAMDCVLLLGALGLYFGTGKGRKSGLK